MGYVLQIINVVNAVPLGD